MKADIEEIELELKSLCLRNDSIFTINKGQTQRFGKTTPGMLCNKCESALRVRGLF